MQVKKGLTIKRLFYPVSAFKFPVVTGLFGNYRLALIFVI